MHYKTKSKKTRLGWGLYRYENGKLLYQARNKWPEGLNETMSREQANIVIRSINSSEKIKFEERKALGARKRIEVEGERECAWLPLNAVETFEGIHITPNKNRPTYEKLLSTWKTARQMIIESGVDPSFWMLGPGPVYEWWRSKSHGQDYARRVMRLANKYGAIYCRLYGKAFEAIGTALPANIKVEMEEEKIIRKSLPLLPKHLLPLKRRLSPEEYRWVAITWAFGLRPEETDLFTAPQGSRLNWWLEGEVLVIDQPKLKDVPKKDRYKRIPVFTRFQREAIKWVLTPLKRPTVRRAHQTFPPGVSLYGARHGFCHYMERRGQPIQKVSKWLGHRSILTTERYYRDHGILAKPEE